VKTRDRIDLSYISTHHQRRDLEVRSYLHFLDDLALLSIGREAGLATDSLWTRLRREHFLTAGKEPRLLYRN